VIKKTNIFKYIKLLGNFKLNISIMNDYQHIETKKYKEQTRNTVNVAGEITDTIQLHYVHTNTVRRVIQLMKSNLNIVTSYAKLEIAESNATNDGNTIQKSER
jgi:hypothetical protein